jgi:ribosomal protein S17
MPVSKKPRASAVWVSREIRDNPAFHTHTLVILYDLFDPDGKQIGQRITITECRKIAKRHGLVVEVVNA